jgi:hypothetical protein
VSEAQPLLPEGFLTLFEALDRAQRAWRLRDKATAVESSVPDPILGGINLYAGGRSWTDPPEPDRSPARTETWNRLRRGLADGNLSSCILRSSGELESVPRAAWRRKENADANMSGEVSYANGTEEIRSDACVKSTDLDDFLSGKPNEATAPFPGEGMAIRRGESNKGGAPIKYDWDAMWVEVVRIVQYDSLPPKPADLRKRLQVWFDQSGLAVPGDTAMKEKMRLLYAMIDVSLADDMSGLGSARSVR